MSFSSNSIHFHRPTRAIVHLGAIRANFLAIRNRVGAERRVWAVVKADAYGHGMAQVARTCLDAGAWGLALATVDETLEARERFPRARILLLGPAFPPDAPTLVSARIEVATGSLEMARALSEAACSAAGQAHSGAGQAHSGGGLCEAVAHLKIDSGMGRFGFAASEVERVAPELAALKGLHWEACFTHFAVSDGGSEEHRAYTREQAARFVRAVEIFRRCLPSGHPAPYMHTCNSGGILQHPDVFFDGVRPGVILYGHYPDPTCERTIPLLPGMTFMTRIAMIRTHPAGASLSYGRLYTCPAERRIALLPVGYADGYDRGLSNRGEVVIRGRRAPIRGRVCMDQILADVTDIPEASVGDDVVLFGGPEGPEGRAALSAEEMAALLGTIPYEVTCRVSRRVPRVFEEGK